MSQNKVNEYKHLFDEYFNLYKSLLEQETDPNIAIKPSALRQKHPPLWDLYNKLSKLHIQLFHEVPKTF